MDSIGILRVLYASHPLVISVSMQSLDLQTLDISLHVCYLSCLLFSSLLDSAPQYIEYIHICQMSTVQNIESSAQSQTHFIMSSWTDKLSNLEYND